MHNVNVIKQHGVDFLIKDFLACIMCLPFLLI
jgi:hypothetical protein